MRQVIDSPIVHRLVLEYQPQTKKPSNKVIGAVCHGVMVLAAAKGPDGKSAIHDCVTTALPGTFESGIFWGTRVFLGDYYKTYGAGSENVETYVSGSLRLTEHLHDGFAGGVLRATLLAQHSANFVPRSQVRKALDDNKKQYKNSVGMAP